MGYLRLLPAPLRTALWLVFIAIIALTQGLPVKVPTAQAVSAGSRINWQGGNWYLLGANVPWYNWACDFGCGSGGGVSTASVRNALAGRFAQLQAAGGRSVRWWTFEGDPWQITRDGSGAPTGLSTSVYADFDAALELAEQYDLYYDFVLFSAPSALPSAWLSDGAQRARLAAALAPLFARYNGNPRVLSWEVFNEPDFDVWRGNVDEANLRATVKAVADAVHANSSAYVTVGMGFADGLPMVQGLGLDYYQAHWYDYMSGGTYCMRCNSYSFYQSMFTLDAPLVVGEYFASPDADALQRFEDFYAKGYAGAWAWSLFWDHTYDQMKIDLTAMKTFSDRHNDVGPRRAASAPTQTPTPTLTPTPIVTLLPTSTATGVPPTVSPSPAASATAVPPTASPTSKGRRPVKIKVTSDSPTRPTGSGPAQAPSPGQQLVVTVAVTTSADHPSNRLRELRFAEPRNARIEIGTTQSRASAFTYPVTGGPQELSFAVTRIGAGPFLVPFTVIDDDGEWPTFVGEGA